MLLGCAAFPRNLDAQGANSLSRRWNDAVHTLAEKIATAAASARTISLDVNNISSLTQSNATAIRRALETDLERRGIRVSDAATAEAQVKVTLSEGEEGLVWAAEIRRGQEERVEIVSVAKDGNDDVSAIPSMGLQRNVVFVQKEPMIDFRVQPASNGQRPLVSALLLDNHLVYQYSGVEQSASAPLQGIAKVQPSRDLRGQLTETAEHQQKMYMANISCISGSGSSCGEQPDGGWTFSDGSESPFVAGRNYFSGVVLFATNLKESLPPFYTAAMVSVTNGSFERIQTELDGKARLYQSGSERAEETFNGWGDDIATIRPGCDQGWQVLVTGTADWTQSDQIQIYEIKGNQAVAIGQPLNFPGPILALWSSQDEQSARVVSRNLQTGMYEASIVSVVCGN
jgi:hypothetical protein